VALLFKQGAAMIKGSLAALKAGKIYAPLDYSMPLGRIRAILEDSQADLIVTDRENVSLAGKVIADRKRVLNIDDLGGDFSDGNLHLSIAPARPAFIHYTSGSTGAPKGVAGSHRNELVNIMLKTRALHVVAEDRISLLRSNNVGATSDMLLGLLNGAAVVPVELKEEGLARLADWLIEQEITIFTCVASVYRHCVRSLSGRERFPKLRLIHLGGEPVFESDVALYKKYFSNECLLAIRLGISETKTATYYFFNKSTPVRDGVVPVGYPLDGYEIEILDASGERLGPNAVGEIAVKSACLAEGYWRQPELTQAKFLPDPQRSDRRSYHTGDLGYLTEDGCLVHVGRKDAQVKIRGYRVETAEIEKALLDFPDLMHASVIPREDGLERKRLAAYIVKRPGRRLSIPKLRACLETKLPSYMVPFSFAILPSLPLTSSGKINRRALPPPEKYRREIVAPYVAPATSVEKFLARLWAEVLDVVQVGLHDSFPQLGGDSLLGARIVARVNDCFALDRPLKTLFETPRVAELAAFILEQEGSPGESERIAAILLKIEGMSADDVRATLAAEKGATGNV
jgi:amino acid adenylation domain-containing protein